MTILARKFANIATASNGQQVLFFIEPHDGGLTLHQVADFDIGQIDLKIEVEVKEGREDDFYRLVESFDVDRADRVLSEIHERINAFTEENSK